MNQPDISEAVEFYCTEFAAMTGCKWAPLQRTPPWIGCPHLNLPVHLAPRLLQGMAILAYGHESRNPKNFEDHGQEPLTLLGAHARALVMLAGTK